MNEGIHTLYEQGGAVRLGQYFLLGAGLTNLVLYHTLRRSPDIVMLQVLNVVADNGYSPGDEINVGGNLGVNSLSGLAIWCRPGIVSSGDTSGATLYLNLKTSGVAFVLVANRWKVRLKALWFPSMGRV